MKKQQLILTALLFSFGFANSQSQQKNWYISPVKVDMAAAQPVVSTLNQPLANAPVPGFGQSFSVVNGYYDKVGNLIFYMVNGGIYDQYNTLIGSTPTNGGAEIIIIPFDNNDNCQLKFNIFTTSGGGVTSSDDVNLICTILDMKGYNVNSYIAETISLPASTTASTEFGSIAATPRNPISGEYFLYFMGAPGTVGGSFGQIKKLVIHTNGNVSTTTSPTHACVYPDNLATPPVTNANASAEVFSRELEVLEYTDPLHPGYLAWASLVGSAGTQLYRYHYLQLDVHGEYISNSYTEFNIPNSSANNASGFRGVELYRAPNGAVKLFMGAGSDGIYATDLPLDTNPVFTFVTGTSPDYGNSQIELAYNGKMYASSATGIVGAFDPGIFPLTMSTGSFSISNPPNSGWQGAPLYTLPDQLDDQNYDSLPTCTCSFIPTASVQNVIGGNTIWSPGSLNNPWNTSGDVQIIDQIHLSGNANLTIQNMTFRFSPNARVLIDAGSTLILENTVFTSDYDFENCPQPYTWKGITVLGNNTANQFTANAQGKLVLKLGSLVKFAECGASIFNPLTTGNASNGGIVNVFDGAFINCKTGGVN